MVVFFRYRFQYTAEVTVDMRATQATNIKVQYIATNMDWSTAMGTECMVVAMDMALAITKEI